MKSFLTFERLENMFRYKPEGYTHMGKKRFFKAFERLVPVRSRDWISDLIHCANFHFFSRSRDSVKFQSFY